MKISESKFVKGRKEEIMQALTKLSCCDNNTRVVFDTTCVIPTNIFECYTFNFECYTFDKSAVTGCDVLVLYDKDSPSAELQKVITSYNDYHDQVNHQKSKKDYDILLTLVMEIKMYLLKTQGNEYCNCTFGYVGMATVDDFINKVSRI